jgi:hypothetical protein
MELWMHVTIIISNVIKWPNLTFHKEPRPISLGATTLCKVIMFKEVIIFRMKKLSLEREANGFSIVSYPYIIFHQTCTWSIVIRNIGLCNYLIVVNGLLIIDFILPLVYSCPSWSRNSLEEIWRVESLLCETMQG